LEDVKNTDSEGYTSQISSKFIANFGL